MADILHEDAERHVRPGRRRCAGVAHPQDAGHQGFYPVTERREHALQQAVLFEAIAATPALDELGVDRRRRQVDPTAEKHVDGLEGDRRRVAGDDAAKGREIGRWRPGMSDAGEVAVEVNGKCDVPHG
ncbi:MAG TPA: hypothetical protein VGO12_19700 [Ensifer sp.]|jgi:hypothetical protein|nr:hypothetical protein [Ensifer sp.]